MDNYSYSSWRTGLPQDTREKIVKRIMDTLDSNMPPTRQKSMGELLKIAQRLEENIFRAATDRHAYLRKISLKMLCLQTKAQATPANAVQGRLGSAKGVVKSLDADATPLIQTGPHNLSSAVQLHGQVTSQAHKRQRLVAQSHQNNLTANVMQNSSGLGSSLPGLTGIPQTGALSPHQPIMYDLQEHQKQRAFPESYFLIFLVFLHFLFLLIFLFAFPETCFIIVSVFSFLVLIVYLFTIPESSTASLDSSSHSGDVVVTIPESSTASVDSLSHSGAIVVPDHREVVWPKLQILRDKYLQDMKELDGVMTTKITMSMTPEQSQKLPQYTAELHRMIHYLTVPKERIPPGFTQDKLEAFEKRIVNITENVKRHRQQKQLQQQEQKLSRRF